MNSISEESPNSLFSVAWEEVKKHRITFLASFIHVFWTGNSLIPVGAHKIGKTGLDLSVLNWYTTIFILLAFWGVVLSWRLFFEESHANWDIKLSAKFVIFFSWIIFPISFITIFCENFWPEIKNQSSQIYSYIVPYSQSAALTAFGAFYANALFPGLSATVVGVLYSLNLALIGAFHPVWVQATVFMIVSIGLGIV
ncbi:hypothetical protein HYY75_11855, partial [bacterium]|nr:hypothetical protein [bacterium]